MRLGPRDAAFDASRSLSASHGSLTRGGDAAVALSTKQCQYLTGSVSVTLLEFHRRLRTQGGKVRKVVGLLDRSRAPTWRHESENNNAQNNNATEQAAGDSIRKNPTMLDSISLPASK